MKTMPVGKVKTHFSEVLEEVRKGSTVGILYGRAKKTVAMIVPYVEEKVKKRKLGILDGKIAIKFMPDFEMTTEELLSKNYLLYEGILRDSLERLLKG